MIHYKVRDYALLRPVKNGCCRQVKEENALTMHEKIEAMLEKGQKTTE